MSTAVETTRLSLATDSGVAIVTFSNPPHEYMDAQTEADLAMVLDRIDADDATRVIIFTGASRNVFVRHYDVRDLETRGRALAARGKVFAPNKPVPESLVHVCYRRITESRKPFIAAINGTAMGGGFELALACDFRLVQAGPFSLGLPEINIGILPGAGGTQRLTTIVGQARALELMLLGRTISPHEAAALGLAMECVDGPVLVRARQIADELAAKSPHAIGHIKQLVRGMVDHTRGLAAERTLFCDLMVGADGISRMEAMNQGGFELSERRRRQDPREDGKS